MSTALLADLTLKVRQRAHLTPHPCEACAATTLADRPDATVVRHATTVAKAHAPHTDPAALTPRLAAAARLPGILLPPLNPAPVTLHGRLVTFWPYGTPVDPDDPDAAPWEAAATLLARLHRSPAPADLPPMRGPVKAADAITRLRAALTRTPTPPAAAAPILRAWATLPAWARGEAPMPAPLALCHGDLHLGQLVRHPATPTTPARPTAATTPDPWRLIDIDDLGIGVPAWDLARPAAWYACGLLAPRDFSRFLDAYRAAGGPAVPPAGDPWPALDTPARALTVQTAARALTKALAEGRPLDEVEQALVDACARMDGAPPQTAAQVTP